MNIIRLQGSLEKRNGIYYEYDADSSPLGEGGMGRVFKGFRVIERTNERIPVAIKAIYEKIPERVVERARRESEIQLDNDNLIKMYGFVESVSLNSEGKNITHYHVIMELLVGVTLENIINGVTYDSNGMQMPFASELYTQYIQDRNTAVIRIMKSVLSGLMALHDKGYIHRDIDPSNIMVTIDGKIKLIDFGICKQIVSLESIDKALTSSGVFMGKVNYAAPELVLGDVKSQNYTTDIYALGILMYQLYTGHLPFSGTDQEILSANLRTPLPMKDLKNWEFRQIIKKATNKKQSKRYASAAELRVDIEKVSTNRHKIYNKKMFIPYVAAILSILLFIVIVGISRPKEKEDNNDDTIVIPTEPIVKEPTCEEIYNNALYLLSQKDSINLQIKGKNLLKMLVEEKSYDPAKFNYYVIQLNTIKQEEAKKGFEGLNAIIQNDSLNDDALFECGLTLSKGNRFFQIPTNRQSILNIEMDLEKANALLFKAMKIDSTDYKSVYWAFNNLIELKLDGTLPPNGDEQIVKLFELFDYRAKNHTDSIAILYKNAIASDGETLKAWGLIN